MKGVSPQDTFEHICKEDQDKPTDEQTIFVCSYLDIDQEADVDNKSGFVTDDGYQVALGTTVLLALHYGLKEVKNLHVEGEAVELKRDQGAKKLKGGIRPWRSVDLSKIPKSARQEIAEAIRGSGELKDEERKN